MVDSALTNSPSFLWAFKKNNKVEDELDLRCQRQILLIKIINKKCTIFTQGWP